MKSFLLLICNLPFLVYSQQTGEEIMKRTAAAIKNLTSISYSIYVNEFGEKNTANVTLTRTGVFPVFETSKVKVSGTSVTEQGPILVSFVSSGNIFEYFDNKSSRVTRVEDPTYAKLSRTGISIYFSLIPPPYTLQEPMANLFSIAKKMELVGDTIIYSIACYKIAVLTEVSDPSGTKHANTATWFIGKRDYLIYGSVSKFSQQYIRINRINKKYPDEYFRLSSSNNIHIVTGSEITGDGLLALNSEAPDWILPASGKDSIHLKELKGKIILLDFWGTWCLPCIKAMPDIQEIHEKFKDSSVVVIGISVEMENSAKPLEFVKEKKYTYPILVNGSSITKEYKVNQFPTIYIIDKAGKIIHAEYGTNRVGLKNDLINIITKALKTCSG